MAAPQRPWEVVFDGSCAFCRGSCRLLERGLAEKPVVFVEGTAVGLSQDEFTELRVRTPEGRELLGFEAVVHLLALSGRWSFLWRALLHTPFRQLGSLAYRLVARHRHRIPFPSREGGSG